MSKPRDKTPKKTTRIDKPVEPSSEKLTPDDEAELDRIDERILIDEELAADQLPPVPDRDTKRERELRKAVKAAVRTPEQSRAALRRKTRIFYDLQRLRIQTAGRTYKRATDIELHELDLEVLDYRAQDLLRAERAALSDIRVHLSTMPAYMQILADKEKWKGVGPTLAAVILSEVDIRKADTVSALWRFAGLATVPSRRCTSCFDPVIPDKEDDKLFHHEFNRKEKCKLGVAVVIDNTVESAKAERGVKGEKLPFNRFLKTKMVGVLSGCILKATTYHCTLCEKQVVKERSDEEGVAQFSHNRKDEKPTDCTLDGEQHLALTDQNGPIEAHHSPWRRFYVDYKHRLESKRWGRNDGHRHQAALRYMTKMLLMQFWEDFRKLEKLPIRGPYAEEFLGKFHKTA